MHRSELNRFQFFLVLIFFLIALPARGGEEPFRLYPLPLLEMEKVLSRWMHEYGYVVSKSRSSSGRCQLRGIRENESWHIVIQPHSPLFSSISAEYLLNGRENSRRVRDLWAFLDDYVAKDAPINETGDTAIPPFLFGIDSMVCLRAFAGNVPIHFTGSVVDNNGTILSTAHDLDDVNEINVTLSDGRSLSGRLMKRDAHRDLALIQVEFRFSSSLDFHERRRPFKEQEKIFALTCSEGKKRILPGLVAGPMRHSDNLPLWQVEMDTPLGSSGSPVFDREGKIVAIIKGRYRGTPSIGFLIPLETVVEFLNEQ